MKKFLLVVLIVVAALIAIKLLPLALALAAVLAVAGLLAFSGVVGAGLLLTLLLAPVWIPVLAMVGLVALGKKLFRTPVAA
jgi:hypothetical protein